MELRKEIKKISGFRNEYEKTIVNLYYTNCFLQSDFASIYDTFKITSQQFMVLRILANYYPGCACIGLIKEHMLDKNSDITRIVERLKRKKLVGSSVCRKDKRRMEIKLTRNGFKMTRNLYKIVSARIDKVCSLVNDKEMKIVNRVLDKVRDYHSAM